MACSILARKAVTFVNVSTAPRIWRSLPVYGATRRRKYLSPSRVSTRCGAPSLITRVQILLRSSTPARVLPRGRPRSETFRPNTVMAARLMRAIVRSRLSTTIGTSTASSTPISSAVIPPEVAASPDTAPVTESSSSLAMKCLYLLISGTIQRATPLQHVIGYKRESLTQRQKQRLRSRHVKCVGIAGQKSVLQDTGLVRSHSVPQCFGYGSLKPRVIFDGDKMRVILAESRQHSSVDVSVEVIHGERAEDRNILLMRELVKQVFEIHTRGYVAALPKNVNHLTPPAHFRVPSVSASL